MLVRLRLCSMVDRQTPHNKRGEYRDKAQWGHPSFQNYPSFTYRYIGLDLYIRRLVLG